MLLFLNPFKYIGLLAFLLCINACQTETAIKEDFTNSEDVEDLINVETDIKLDMVINDMPSPIDLTLEIANTGAALNMEMLNPSRNASVYATSYKKSINLGIYVADLGYVTAYDKAQDAVGYLNAVKSLSDNLRISGAFDSFFLKSFEENIGNKDSLSNLIKYGFQKADQYLRSNERVSTASFVLAGGWVEGLYILTQIIGEEEKTEKNMLLFQKVGEQKYALSNLIDLIALYKNNPDHNRLLKALIKIQKIYDPIFDPTQVSQIQVQEIRKAVEVLRQNITKK